MTHRVHFGLFPSMQYCPGQRVVMMVVCVWRARGRGFCDPKPLHTAPYEPADGGRLGRVESCRKRLHQVFFCPVMSVVVSWCVFLSASPCVYSLSSVRLQVFVLHQIPINPSSGCTSSLLGHGITQRWLGTVPVLQGTFKMGQWYSVSDWNVTQRIKAESRCSKVLVGSVWWPCPGSLCSRCLSAAAKALQQHPKGLQVLRHIHYHILFKIKQME